MTSPVSSAKKSRFKPPKLNIVQCEELKPPHRDAGLLAGFCFGGDCNKIGDGLIATGLQPINRSAIVECWWYDGEVEYANHDGVEIAGSDEYVMLTIQRAFDDDTEFAAVSRDVYRSLFNAIQRTNHRYIAKIWNYFGGITEGQGDLERYRQFSIGRAQVFAEQNLDENVLPAGTAIGTHQQGVLSVVALTSKYPFAAIENPRQTSAYRYPRQYGPESPRFSRGGTVIVGDDSLHLISGTAAIVGHETQHPNDVGRQLKVTADNLRSLCGKLSAGSSTKQAISIEQIGAPRIYLRMAEDFDRVTSELDSEIAEGFSERALFLHAEICRSELMLEVDGVVFRAGDV
jgi:chorismate lyase/3-hydroxybenzoate synthase